MKRLALPNGTTLSYDKTGSGPPLVLVHGAFSDHHTNWEFVKPSLAARFTVYAIARRGRGQTDATHEHTLEDESRDVAALMQEVGEPVFLLGHSYGGHCALAATLLVPGYVRKLVLYEPAWPALVSREALARLDALAVVGAWDEFAMTFFRDTLRVPLKELEALRATELWPPIAADGRASLGDLHALHRHEFDAGRYRQIEIPVLLQIGSESPRDLYVTDALAAVLPNARIQELPGQAHEGMTTAPQMYAEAVLSFLLDGGVAGS